jgi:hypothetical protein
MGRTRSWPTTGAGKSELLRSWIAALALASPPEELSLLFMAYDVAEHRAPG